MKQADVVIVGGSAAGPVAAMTSKRHYPDKSVLEIRKEKPERVMVPCGVPLPMTAVYFSLDRSRFLHYGEP